MLFRSPEGWREAVYENKRRVAREKGKQLQRRRAEVVERTFAHVCATGGARRTWIRGLVEVGKRYLVTVMAHNLGVILRALIGVGKPREWAAMRALLAAWHRFWSTIVAETRDALRRLGLANGHEAVRSPSSAEDRGALEIAATSTGCYGCVPALSPRHRAIRCYTPLVAAKVPRHRDFAI